MPYFLGHLANPVQKVNFESSFLFQGLALVSVFFNLNCGLEVCLGLRAFISNLQNDKRFQVLWPSEKN